MKKIVMGILTILAVCSILAGCSMAKHDGEAGGQDETFRKAQMIVALRPDDDVSLFSASEEQDIEAFIDNLKLEDWKIAELPEDATEHLIYHFQQEDTIKFGETSTDGVLKDVVTLSVYGDIPYATMTVLEQPVHFQIPEDVAGYLNEPLK